MRRSFRFRLVLAFAAVGIAGAALTALLVNLALGAALNRYLQGEQQTRQDQLVAALADSYTRSSGWDTTDLRGVEPLLHADGGVLRLEDAQGRTVWVAEPATSGSGMDTTMGGSMMSRSTLGPERPLSIDVNGAVVGTAFVRFPPPGVLPQDRALMATVDQLFFLGGLVAGLAAIVLGVVLARRATSPVRELTAAARALAAGQRSVRVRQQSTDEFGEMAAAFNHMADAVQVEDRLRRSFAADVAHELRTPLSVLRSQLEALQDGIRQPTDSAFESLHEEVLRLSRLVADLEVLASADAAGFTLQRHRLDLGPLLEGTVDQFRSLFDGERVRLEAELVPVAVDADAIRIRQVVSNLLSNALRFTPAGGVVTVGLAAEPGFAVVRVSDTGPGIPPEELPHVFDRFFRGRAPRAGGSGIGLTVARDLAHAHGGWLQAANGEGGGCTFTLWLPLASPDLSGAITQSSQPAPTVQTNVSGAPSGL